MEPTSRPTRTLALAGAVASALAASACCIGPLVLALLGIGGAGFLVALEPYRPVLTVVTLALLGTAWALALRPRKAEEGEDCDCERPAARRAGRPALWVATVVVALALAFPYLAPVLFS